MASGPPKRPNRRLKRPSLMSFRALPPLPTTVSAFSANSEVFVTNSSQIFVTGAESCNTELSADVSLRSARGHRKWVKLRTSYTENISASGVLFREFCDSADENLSLIHI